MARCLSHAAVANYKLQVRVPAQNPPAPRLWEGWKRLRRPTLYPLGFSN
jgi:hypothetical protein